MFWWNSAQAILTIWGMTTLPYYGHDYQAVALQACISEGGNSEVPNPGLTGTYNQVYQFACPQHCCQDAVIQSWSCDGTQYYTVDATLGYLESSFCMPLSKNAGRAAVSATR